MKKVVVIGCGFAGVTAATILSKFKKDLRLTIVDKKACFDFLPMLPDVIGRTGIDAQMISYPIKDISRRLGFNFLNEEVHSVNLKEKAVFTSASRLEYDYLVIASGSETNFYGNGRIKDKAYKLDSTEDAKLIKEAVGKNIFNSYVISGGGYTGVEVATNIRAYLNKRSRKARIVLIEKSPYILGPLPDWMKDYVASNLKALNVDVLTGVTVKDVESERITLSTSEVFENAMLIWVSGVKTSKFIDIIDTQKTSQGRIKADEYLRLDEAVFLAGDAADVLHMGKPLRMAVQFAISQAACASKNIINSIKGKRLNRYNPLDLGYIIPMANNRSCGKVFEFDLKGILPTLFHYIMCIYRTYGLGNKFKIILGCICEFFC